MIGLLAARAFFTASSKRCSQRMDGGWRLPAEEDQRERDGRGHRAAFTRASNSGWNPGGWSQNDSGCHCTPITNLPVRHLHPFDDPVVAPAGGEDQALAQLLDRLVVEAVHGDPLPAQDVAQPRPGQEGHVVAALPSLLVGIVHGRRFHLRRDVLEQCSTGGNV